MRTVLTTLLAWAVGSGVAADEGILEIDAACVATGCLPGDLPGFPVEITEHGSYALTSNLAVQGGKSGISISASSVTLNLRGFSIACSSKGSCGDGIVSGGANVTIRGGLVAGFGGFGVKGAAGGPTYVEDLTVIDATATGIMLGDGSRVRAVRVRGGKGDGIWVGSGSSVTHSISVDNGGNGIVAQPGSQITENVCARNGQEGISLPLAGGGGASTVARNALSGNDTGIGVFHDARVVGNTVRANTTTGILSALSTRFGYARNYLVGNGTAEAQMTLGPSADPVELGTNFCGTDTVCP